MLSKNFDMPLNVVIIMKYNKKGNLCKATNRIILFCTNNKEDYQNIMDIYQVRFQIEFNFRDARQYFGLSHFKNVKEQQVKNVIGFSFFMVTLSNVMIAYLKHQDPNTKISIQDLKACFRAQKYLLEFKNMPTFEQGDIFNPDFYSQNPILGAINH